MSTLKLAITHTREGVADIHDRRSDVDDGLHLGMDKAQTLVSQDAHEWVTRILDHAAGATEQEIPGLIEASECLLSSDERPAAQLIDQRRGR